ncbi:MerR family transcriptional regulator [Paenibacillus jilunlii]|uniref:DNA-binding transcriptional regulator, MerR family n=1 Tax=Paenibacillus jilunlii TaxID=682956 RepID=A0A1G9GD25_9BACL|nr:MerR family transcriptional regulator [Paenibacillus jilunlii]KWX71439.1 MerR family transcriptional regulator [Paenibacillus jilunlii]SDK98634.1 DNA-binding transcriptional regulator, MerR family [Paenibacillus jilunlii]
MSEGAGTGVHIVQGYSIKQTSELTGITEDTIRYYEKIGLLPRAQRKGNSHRIYSDNDIETMKLITCLKKTGMSLDDMRPYLDLSLDSNLSEYPELHEMILNHKQKILDQIASLQQIVDLIDSKIDQNYLGPQECVLTGDQKKMPVRRTIR